MPELPEVETVKRGLNKKIINKTIINIDINTDKLRYPIQKYLFLNIIDKKIKEITRRGKHLIIILKKDLQIIIHLGMSGTIKVQETDEYQKIKHDHIILGLSNKTSIIYNDPRKFGYWIININNFPLQHKVLASQGVEPLTNNFNFQYLIEKLSKTSRKIKQTIMDNTIVVGIGNIYANEVLFDSNILPTRASNTITIHEANKLVKSIKKILEKAILNGGTTLKDYKNIEGKPGYFNQKLNIYGRVNKKCYNCNTKIKSLIICQRNTFYCKKCQK